MKELIEAVEKGDADASARALAEVAPDGWAVAREYTELIRVAETAAGEINLSILYDACTGYHRWHSVVIEDKERGKAILEWICQKIWEMPSGSDRSALIAHYFDDLARLIDTGKLPAVPTLKLARKTVAWDDIHPGPIAAELFRLLKGFAGSTDPELRKYVFSECLGEPYVCIGSDEQGSEVLAFIRKNYPDERVPATFQDLHLAPTYMMPIARIGRADYEAIPTLSPSQWVLHKMEKGSLYLDQVGVKYLLGCMLDRYDSAPDAINKTIESWIRDDDVGLFEYQVFGMCVESASVYGSVTNKSHPIELPEAIVDILVRGLSEQNSKSDLDSHTLMVLHIQMNRMMQALTKRDGGVCSAKTVQRQEWILEAQLKSIIGLEQRNQKLGLNDAGFGSEAMHDEYSIKLRLNFPANQALYCPEAREFLRKKAHEILQNKAGYDNLSQQAQARIEKALKDVLALP